MAKSSSETPLMQQHRAIKQKYPDAILLFRVGDFYETFGEDAIIASKVLGITLTKRNNGAASSSELAGFPHHSLDTYLHKLVKAGFDAKQAAELVGDVNLATLILNTKTAGLTFTQVKNKIIDVQAGLEKIKNLGNPFAAIEGMMSQFNTQYDAMMERFRIDEQKARNKYQPAIDAAQAEVDRIQKVIDGINKDIDKTVNQTPDTKPTQPIPTTQPPT